jgi:hypothetical protein
MAIFPGDNAATCPLASAGWYSGWYSTALSGPPHVRHWLCSCARRSTEQLVTRVVAAVPLLDQNAATGRRLGDSAGLLRIAASHARPGAPGTAAERMQRMKALSASGRGAAAIAARRPENAPPALAASIERGTSSSSSSARSQDRPDLVATSLAASVAKTCQARVLVECVCVCVCALASPLIWHACMHAGPVHNLCHCSRAAYSAEASAHKTGATELVHLTSSCRVQGLQSHGCQL